MRTALPFSARSQRDTSTCGFSGVEFLKCPFQVLPRNGRNGSKCSSSDACSAASPSTAKPTTSNRIRERIFIRVVSSTPFYTPRKEESVDFQRPPAGRHQLAHLGR